ncbi:unnamed protein product [Cuscuta epithymum]|nr:unnamed protein product [Cuscuta epithymum]
MTEADARANPDSVAGNTRIPMYF